jgi:voltage-gated potassium channel
MIAFGLAACISCFEGWSYFDSIRGILFFFLGESADTPTTTPGLVLAVFVFIGGLAIITYIIGKVASYFVEKKLEVRMPEELEKHIVICNWNNRGDRVVKELHSTTAVPETEIVIIADKDINEKELRLNPEYEKAFFVRSDPTSHDVLEKARAHLAKCVIVLADDICTDPDAKSALISLAIKSLVDRKKTPKKPHIVAEIINHHKIQHLKDAGVNEWVCSEDYGLGIIAQCALHRKLSDVYQQLLTYSEETNEMYLINSSEYSDDFFGRSFKDISKMINDKRHPSKPTILLGVKRNDHVILNPKANDFDKLRQGDSLIIMAYTKQDIIDIMKK